MLIAGMGPTQAALVTQRALERLRPATIILVGIAAGLDAEVRLSDVIVANVVDAVPDAHGAFQRTPCRRARGRVAGRARRVAARVAALNAGEGEEGMADDEAGEGDGVGGAYARSFGRRGVAPRANVATLV